MANNGTVPNNNEHGYTGFSISRGPDMTPIVRMHAMDDPKIRVPQELPTYRRVNAIHCGFPEEEVRLRAASLANSCRESETENPVDDALIDVIFRYGAVSGEQAETLREYIAFHDDEYIQDEARLLLEAGGHLEEPL